MERYFGDRSVLREVVGHRTEAAGPLPAGTPYRADDPKLLL
jgi:hypothetical protein